MNENSDYSAIIKRFAAKRILVLGDLLLDVYLKGRSTRLCPEAPVPVVDIEERIVTAGGAANTVCNLKALGASVHFCTVIGNDAEGDEAVALLKRLGLDESLIIRTPERRTITKSRVMAGSQIVTRIDHGSTEPIEADTSSELMMRLKEMYDACDAIVISDYDKGVITSDLLRQLAELRGRGEKFIAIDSKRLDYFSMVQPSLVKPNYREATKLLGVVELPAERAEQVSRLSGELFRRTRAQLITATLDEEGSVVIREGHAVARVEAPRVPQAQVAGAGDSYLSAFVLAYLTTGDESRSAHIATAAADIAIRKECTGTCTHTELKNYFNIHSKFIADLHDLKEVCDAYRASGKRIAFTNGCFDILHSGHVTYLHRARELADILIVGLNTDESIKRIKGANRPINALPDRLKVLGGLSSVDHIIPFGSEEDDTPIPVIRAVRPDIFAKGGDYTRQQLPEAPTVEAFGGKIVFLEHVPDHSTTRIINRIGQLSTTIPRTIFNLPS